MKLCCVKILDVYPCTLFAIFSRCSVKPKKKSSFASIAFNTFKNTVLFISVSQLLSRERDVSCI